MCRRIALIVLFTLELTSIVKAANDQLVRDMQGVIDADGRLSAERKAGLDRIVVDVLSTQPELSEDKRVHATRQLRQYLDEMVPPLESAPAARFALFEDIFRWALQNYAVLPPITEQQRGEMRKAIQAVSAGLQAAIDGAYVDTPDAVRAELVQRVQSRLKSLLNSDKVGNYFYPQFLYPPRREIHPDEVPKELSRVPSMNNKHDAFAEAVGPGQDAQRGLSEAKVRAFVNREVGNLNVQIDVMISRLSGIGRLRPDQYVQMPKGLQERTHALATQAVMQSEGKAQAGTRPLAPATRPGSQPAAASSPAS